MLEAYDDILTIQRLRIFFQNMTSQTYKIVHLGN